MLLLLLLRWRMQREYELLELGKAFAIVWRHVYSVQICRVEMHERHDAAHTTTTTIVSLRGSHCGQVAHILLEFVELEQFVQVVRIAGACLARLVDLVDVVVVIVAAGVMQSGRG